MNAGVACAIGSAVRLGNQMSKRTEFPKSVKLKRFEYAKGRCETCTQKIVGTAQYDHVVPDAVGGAADFDNCRVQCVRCHRVKTSTKDVPEISRSTRIYEKRAGVRKTSRGFQRHPEGYDPWSRTWRD